MQDTIVKLLIPACSVAIIVQSGKTLAPRTVSGARATLVAVLVSAGFTWLWIHNLWTPEGIADSVVVAAAAAGIHGTAKKLWPQKENNPKPTPQTARGVNPLNSTSADPQLRLGGRNDRRT